MAKRKKLANILLFLLLVVFPFGRLFGHSIDIIVGLIMLYTLFFRLEKPPIFKYFDNFLIAAIFSYLFSLFVFKSTLVLVGGLYLIRLIAYTYLFVFCLNWVEKSSKKKQLILHSLLALSVITAVFGWLQYFIYPDARQLAVFGWDDHLYRIIGTFLDPAFTALFLVFGATIAVYQYFSSRKKVFLWLTVFLSVTLAFTYSRASYLAFLFMLLSVGILTKKLKTIAIFIILFLIMVLALPRPAGEGVKLERTFSINARLINYREGLTIFKKSPLLGIGFNNLCLAKKEFLGKEEFTSHSCSGLDSSLLAILVTTGVCGFLIFIKVAWEVLRTLNPKSLFGKILFSSCLALFVHSLFTNSLFYPWTMVYLVMLLSLEKFDFRD